MFIISLVIGIVQAINFGYPLFALGLGIFGVLYIFWIDRRDTAVKKQLNESNSTSVDKKKKALSINDISDEDALLFARNSFLQFVKFWKDNELRGELVYDEKLLPHKRGEILGLSQYWILRCDDLKLQMIARMFLPNLSSFQPNIGETALGGLSKTGLAELDHIEKNSLEYITTIAEMVREVAVPEEVRHIVEQEREEIEMWFDNNNIHKRDAAFYARAEVEKVKLAEELGIDLPK